MKASIITTILMILLVAPNTKAQQLVTLNRNKLKTEQTAKSNTKKKTSSTNQKQTIGAKKSSPSRSKSSSRKRRYTSSTPKAASYLRINNQYGDITEYPSYSGCYKTFYVYTDGRDYSVSMLPLWCRVTSKNSSSFTVYIDSNASYDDRSDWFSVKSGSKEVKIHLKQSGKPISISASYYSGYLTHGYYINGVQYMKVNVNLRISGAQNLRLLAVAMVKNEYGNPVYATSGFSNYALNDGSFYAASELTPNTDNDTYNVTLYIPNNALRLYSKKNKLTCTLSLYCEKAGGYISNVNYSIPFVAKNKKGTVTTKNK